MCDSGIVVMQCDHTNAKLVAEAGGTEEGTFIEHYKCDCGAVGRITGQADEPPKEWSRTGQVFNE